MSLEDGNAWVDAELIIIAISVDVQRL